MRRKLDHPAIAHSAFTVSVNQPVGGRRRLKVLAVTLALLASACTSAAEGTQPAATDSQATSTMVAGDGTSAGTEGTQAPSSTTEHIADPTVSTDTTPTDTESSANAAFEALPAVDGGSLTLEEIGTGELRAPSYSLQIGDRADLEISTEITSSLVIAGFPTEPATTLPYTVTLLVRVVGIDAAGNYQVESSVAEISTPGTGDPVRNRRLRSSLNALLGFTTRQLITPQGLVLAGDYDVAEGVDKTNATVLEHLKTQLSQLAIPLPATEIGIGARWRHERVVNFEGVEVTQVSTYTLNSRSDGQLGLSVEIVQSSPPAGALIAELDQPGTAELVSMESGLTYSLLSVSTGLIAPVRAEIDSDSTIVMNLTDPTTGVTVKATDSTSLAITMTTRPR